MHANELVNFVNFGDATLIVPSLNDSTWTTTRLGIHTMAERALQDAFHLQLKRIVEHRAPRQPTSVRLEIPCPPREQETGGGTHMGMAAVRRRHRVADNRCFGTTNREM